MGLQGPRTAEWFARAKGVLVNGVSSGFRYWGDEDTMVIDRGEGAYVVDMDGKRYIDYQLGFGPIILGHADPTVIAAVAEAAAGGTTFAMTTAREIEAAEAVVGAIPWVEGMRFTNTGTEATMHAIRLARAHTGRELVVKFEGCYHGAHDYVLFTTAGSPVEHLGSRRSPVPWQASSGIPEAIRSTIRVLPYNDLEAVERLFRSEGGRIAAILVEPMMGNCFGVMPEPGFLEGLRRVADEYGAVLVFDEVKTGFRMALGGAAEVFGVEPDLGTFAKSMGNGFPIAAVGGRNDIVQDWARGGVTQAGTYSANAVGVAAAKATIDLLATGEPYERIRAAGRALMQGIEGILAEEGVEGHVVGHWSMFSIFFAEEPPREFRDVARHDADLYEETVRGMIRRGVMPVDDGLEPWFVSAAHGDEEVARTLEAFGDALVEAKG
ncbi:MAG TPA: aminotransferase class III-fold pyridoxal phosphate-dependent enzyme [Actinobacteria bacterium]|nr:aminotransferase class III-fold pyridoxal phosphate-dependent enzyme [Actinomycetota bacterium]